MECIVLYFMRRIAECDGKIHTCVSVAKSEFVPEMFQ